MGVGYLTGQGGGGSNIKSIQRGVETLTAGSVSNLDVSINAVDLSKSIVVIYEKTNGSNSDVASVKTRARLANSTTINIYRSGISGTITVAWQVVEFNNVKTLQSGVFGFNASASEQIVAISNINTDKSILFFSFSCTLEVGITGLMVCEGRIASNSTIGFSTFGNSEPVTVNWQVIEFN